MSYQKWIFKYQFLQEESKDLEQQEKNNIQTFYEYFTNPEQEKEENQKTTSLDESVSSKNSNLPGKELYKALSKVLHPDKGGDGDEFAIISLMYKNEDTIGLYLKCEEYQINVDKYLNEDLINSFKNTCNLIEEKHKQIKNTISWVWNEENDGTRKKSIEENILKNHNLILKNKNN